MFKYSIIDAVLDAVQDKPPFLITEAIIGPLIETSFISLLFDAVECGGWRSLWWLPPNVPQELNWLEISAACALSMGT